MKGRVTSITYEEHESSFPLPYIRCLVTVALANVNEGNALGPPGTKVEINVETEENPT